MPKKIRLLAAAQVNNEFHAAGDIVTLPDGVRGPYRSALVAGQMQEEPLFVEVDETAEKPPSTTRPWPAPFSRTAPTPTDGPVARAPLPRIRLLTSAQINNHVYGPGDIVTLPEGVRGPYRSVAVGGVLHDEPLFVPVDEDMEKEREEMRLRHLKETEALDHTEERRVLAAKHSKESHDLLHKQLVNETEVRHKAEVDALQHRHEAEVVAFDKRAEILAAATPPAEVVKEDLEVRQKAEAEALKVKQENEKKVLETKVAEPVEVAPSEPTFHEPQPGDDAALLPYPSPVEDSYSPPRRPEDVVAQTQEGLPRHMPFPPNQPSNPA
jgi:hypothetical protein